MGSANGDVSHIFRPIWVDEYANDDYSYTESVAEIEEFNTIRNNENDPFQHQHQHQDEVMVGHQRYDRVQIEKANAAIANVLSKKMELDNFTTLSSLSSLVENSCYNSDNNSCSSRSRSPSVLARSHRKRDSSGTSFQDYCIVKEDSHEIEKSRGLWLSPQRINPEETKILRASPVTDEAIVHRISFNNKRKDTYKRRRAKGKSQPLFWDDLVEERKQGGFHSIRSRLKVGRDDIFNDSSGEISNDEFSTSTFRGLKRIKKRLNYGGANKDLNLKEIPFLDYVMDLMLAGVLSYAIILLFSYQKDPR